jgi:hypothetical protein
MPELFCQRALVDGEPVGRWEIVVDVDGIGRFTIDDNSNLWDPALPQFVLELRDANPFWQANPSRDQGGENDGRYDPCACGSARNTSGAAAGRRWTHVCIVPKKDVKLGTR